MRTCVCMCYISGIMLREVRKGEIDGKDLRVSVLHG